MALLAVGAVLVVLGILQTTTSRLTQVNCPSGSVLIAKFEYKGGVYVFEKPAGNETTVTITNGTATGGDFEST
ncbi:MAG TPA: hypothetical protein VLD86_09030, partial [Ilumatobacteraceae bacterium]|nr:hypothetical protein [Ilumatobacteraceae bacterium]